MTKKFGIIGNPIKHSLSPILHNYWFKKYNIDAEYSIIEIKDSQLAKIIDKIKDKSLCGINITLPYKQKIVPYVDVLVNDAEKTSSVNTVYIDGDLYVSGDTDTGNKGRLASRFATADSKPKPFDMEHPSKGKGYRLRYACIEGPEVGVYCRGRVKNEKVIRLPAHWRDLVRVDSITVQLQPIGAHQDIIIKRWDEEYVYLQAQGGLPINCFYHVYGERKDVNPLVVEYEGDTWKDYPDPDYNDPQFTKSVNTRTI